MALEAVVAVLVPEKSRAVCVVVTAVSQAAMVHLEPVQAVAGMAAGHALAVMELESVQVVAVPELTDECI